MIYICESVSNCLDIYKTVKWRLSVISKIEENVYSVFLLPKMIVFQLSLSFFPPGIPVFSLGQHEGRTLTGQGHTAVLPTATGEDHTLPLPSSQTSTVPRSNDDQGGRTVDILSWQNSGQFDIENIET